MIFYSAASEEHAAGAAALPTSAGSRAAVFLVTHFEKRQNGRWRSEGPASHTPVSRPCPWPVGTALGKGPFLESLSHPQNDHHKNIGWTGKWWELTGKDINHVGKTPPWDASQLLGEEVP